MWHQRHGGEQSVPSSLTRGIDLQLQILYADWHAVEHARTRNPASLAHPPAAPSAAPGAPRRHTLSLTEPSGPAAHFRSLMWLSRVICGQEQQEDRIRKVWLTVSIPSRRATLASCRRRRRPGPTHRRQGAAGGVGLGCAAAQGAAQQPCGPGGLRLLLAGIALARSVAPGC